jgi:hypothetical protein
MLSMNRRIMNRPLAVGEERIHFDGPDPSGDRSPEQWNMGRFEYGTI